MRPPPTTPRSCTQSDQHAPTLGRELQGLCRHRFAHRLIPRECTELLRCGASESAIVAYRRAELVSELVSTRRVVSSCILILNSFLATFELIGAEGGTMRWVRKRRSE